MQLLKRLTILSALALILYIADGRTDQNDVDALNAVLQQLEDPMKYLSTNWTGNDPCGSLWNGVHCNGTQRVQELHLLNMNLTGTLASNIGNLTSLQVLDVMWNKLYGTIPDTLGNLKNLTLLLLNGNQFSGVLPDSLGYLPNLRRLQIDENNISGPIPKSFQYLNKASHLHMNNNSLTGSIPLELGSLQSLLHLLLDNNNLSGELPQELSNISTLLILQLDNNQFVGSIPPNYYYMSKLTKLSLRNCNLSGIVQGLTSLSSLQYVDLSYNHFIGELPSGKLPANLNTYILAYNELNGTLLENLAALTKLQYLNIRNNSLQGTVPYNLCAGVQFHSPSSRLIIDLRNNKFQENAYMNYTSNVTLWLNGNPVCHNFPLSRECASSNDDSDIKNLGYEAPLIPLVPGCTSDTCDPSLNQDIVYGVDVCFCASPLLVGYRLKSPGFTYFPPFEDDFRKYMSDKLSIFLYQLNISEFDIEPGPRLGMSLKLFPSLPSHRFNDSEVFRLYSMFSDWAIPDSPVFGPAELIYFLIRFPYTEPVLIQKEHPLSQTEYIGIVFGCTLSAAAIIASLLFLLVKLIRQHRFNLCKSENYYQRERIKVVGVQSFTFEELSLATNNFHESMQVGQGGYGKVYKGVFNDGSLVAIKRAKEGSLQGSKEFYTEIELLSRIHHRNLVSLLGFCDDEGEQMLVYEFMANGTLRDHLSAQSKWPLDFRSRIQVALGSARGILYLHTEADPPIFHRDIKASNILLDDKNNTKVADFGLSKLIPVSDVDGLAPDYVSTVVKGTPGYLDPEYFLTHKLTDKSDVYSFGVVLLELITGMQPISHGKNLVREVNMAYEAGMMLSFVDPRMGSYPSECLEPLVRLAMSCCKDSTDERPSMAAVVRDLEDILRRTPDPEGHPEDSDLDMNEFRRPSASASCRSTELHANDDLGVALPDIMPR